MKRSISLDVTKPVEREELESFLGEVPVGVKIVADVYVEQPDRPGFSVTTRTTLQAEW